MAIITNDKNSTKNTITGSNEIDYIVEKRGNTIIKAGAGNDTIFASDGDKIYFGSGNSVLDLRNNESGTYTVYGGTGTDKILLKT